MGKVKFIDLFAGMGGIRKGFELAFNDYGYETECVLTSEIKPSACLVLKANNPDDPISGDIHHINSNQIPDFDVLLGGFPCQPFSTAGNQHGFLDTRGTLFFDIERILKDKRPSAFLLENVEGLVTHDRIDKKNPIGRTLSVILNNLTKLGYNVTWKVLNSRDFGVAQDRKRVYIVGVKKGQVILDGFDIKSSRIKDILENGLQVDDSLFAQKLLKNYSVEELYGKNIKDKRGGKDNIHSWDIEIKGSLTDEQKMLLNMILTERRKKKWAHIHSIDWMDGMPLTINMIRTFYKGDNLYEMLEELTEKGYLKKEYPKIKTIRDGKEKRIQDTTKEIGYNIVTGKLSFPINKILDPQGISPTLVATDMDKIHVVDNGGLRKLSMREGLRLFGYPEDFKFPVNDKDGYDLLGNTVVVPVIRAICERIAQIF